MKQSYDAISARVQRMIGIDRSAPIQISNRLQVGVGSESGSPLHSLTSFDPTASVSADDIRAALVRDQKSPGICRRRLVR
jgi:hypothetical protein